jgi:hypothetical protein
MKKNIFLLLALMSFTTAHAQSWLLSGNSITPGDFLGTTNAEPLVFKTGNDWSGIIEPNTIAMYPNVSLGAWAMPYSLSSGNSAVGAFTMYSLGSGSFNSVFGFGSMGFATGGLHNSAVGVYSLGSNTSGEFNVAIGSNSLFLNDVGSNNVAVGSKSLENNTFESGLVAIGHEALRANTSGSENTAVGFQALRDNTKGDYNTAVGRYALAANTEGGYNAAVGRFALGNNTIGTGNVAMGFHAVSSNRTGIDNTGLGIDALAANTSGRNCVAVGARALRSNQESELVAVGVDALSNNSTGIANTAVGYKALLDNTSGPGNTAVGYSTLESNIDGLNNTGVGIVALYNNNAGSDNVAVGRSSMYDNTGGYSNTAIGVKSLISNQTGFLNAGIGSLALQTNTTGSKNTGVGHNADVLFSNLQNATAVGFNATASASDEVRVGDGLVTSIGGMVGWTTISDARYKKNVQANVPGLDFITKLTPVTYTLDAEGVNKHYDDVRKKNGYLNKDSLQTGSLEHNNPEASKVLYTGFLAQDVEKAALEIGYDFSGVDKPGNESSLYGLRYAEFVPPLVKAIQEQQLEIDVLETQNAELQQMNAALINRLEKLEKLLNAPAGVDDGVSSDKGTQLLQNVPNPFSAETVINYTIADRGNVLLQLFDIKGNKVMDMENSYKE